MHIQKATIGDFEKIMNIYRIAQDYMIENGNPNQWGHSYPTEELVKEDISKGISYIIVDSDDIHGVFALSSEDEPSYEYIEDGEWLNNDEYLTVHRIASDGEIHGIFKCAIDFAKTKSDNIRIDTHHDNIIMQKVIEKNGFCRCGIIFVRDKPRIAYQWIG